MDFEDSAEVPVACNTLANEWQRRSPKLVRVWRFRDAPGPLRLLSPHGGDEDWVAWVPKDLADQVYWAEEGSRFGCCSVSEHQLRNGSQVLIGSHA